MDVVIAVLLDLQQESEFRETLGCKGLQQWAVLLKMNKQGKLDLFQSLEMVKLFPYSLNAFINSTFLMVSKLIILSAKFI